MKFIKILLLGLVVALSSSIATAQTWLSGIVTDARIGTATISSGNLSRVSLSGITATSGDVGKHISVEVGGTVHQTTISGFVNSSTVDITTAASGAVSGVRTILCTDNSSTIQTALNNDIVVYLPPGGICSSALNMTGNRASYLIGVGAPFSGTWLHPLNNSGTFLDAWGRGSIVIEGISIGRNDNPNRPDTGILVGANVDHINLNRLMVTGRLRKAAIAFVGGGLGTVSNSAFWNFGDGFAMAFDLDNNRGFTSNVTITGPYALAPWLFNRVEAHAGDTSTGQAILFRGLDDAVWASFIISGRVNQAGIIRIENTGNGVDTWSGMRRHNYLGGRFEGEGGAITNVFDAQGSCLNVVFGPVMWGATGSMVVGPSATAFKACTIGMP